MRILGAGVIVSAMLLASTAEADTDWYILGRDGCKVAHEDFMKNPGVFILGLKHLGRAYTVDDRRDEGGQIVASIVTDDSNGARVPFFRAQALCEKERLQQQNGDNDLLKKYR